MSKIKQLLKATLFSLTLFGVSISNTLNVSALEILATNYSMYATSNRMTAQELCTSAGLVTTDPTAGVTWNCSSANLDTTKAGKYSINIKATDGADSVIKTIQVKVKANSTNTAPTLTLSTNSVTIYKGSNIDLNSYVAVAYDHEDGNLSPSISGSVNTNKAGTYAVTYTVTDSQGVRATAKLTVKVIVKGTGSDESASITINNTQNEQTATTVTSSTVVDEGKQLPNTADASAVTLSISLIVMSILGAGLLKKKRELID